MKKLLLSTVICLLALCGLARADYPARTKVHFNIHVAYTVKAGEILVPPGNYSLTDLGVSTNALLALTEKGRSQPIALLFTVRIDRRLVNWTDHARVVFD